MKVTFWGVRGSIACPGRKYAIYGGNTSCIEVSVGGATIIFDAGTGLRGLGQALQKRGTKRASLLFSHTHWDHICGFPFFAPAYDATHDFDVLAGHLADNGGIRAALAGQMIAPNFPVPIDVMRASLRFTDFTAGDSFEIARGVNVKTAPLRHPNGATGYRVQHAGKSICYVTDTEHVPGKPDERILGLIEGADVVIYDCTYSDKQFASKVGWGHSTWEEGIRLCRAAKAKKLAIFHHDPDHDDPKMAKIGEASKKVWSGSFVAKEGMSLRLGRS